MGLTGFGISQKEHDGGGLVVVDCDEKTVTVDRMQPVSFDDYAASYLTIEEIST